jgi:hypothetical protein
MDVKVQVEVVDLDVGVTGAACEHIHFVLFCPHYHLEDGQKKSSLTNIN